MGMIYRHGDKNLSANKPGRNGTLPFRPGRIQLCSGVQLAAILTGAGSPANCTWGAKPMMAMIFKPTSVLS